MGVKLVNKSTEKGRARIQELEEAFPQTPKTLILKIETLREGIKRTRDLDYVGLWANPDGLMPYDLGKDGYQSDTVSKEKGWMDKPLGIRFADETCSWVLYNQGSPYEIRYEGYGRYKLYRDQEPIEEVFFEPRPAWYGKKSEKDGSLLCSYLSQYGDSFILFMTPNYCCYFATGDECMFCPVSATQQHFDDVGMELKLTVPMEKFIESFKVCYEEIKERQKNRLGRKQPCGTPGCLCSITLHMTGGGMYDRHKEAKRYERYILGLKEAMGDLDDVTITAEIQALDPEDSKRLAEIGLHTPHYNLECWDKKMFDITCHGKSKFVGWQKWVDCLVAATEYYDRGHVVCGLVPGLEMVKPEGFKTEEEGLASNLEGIEWLAQRGIFTVWTVMCLSQGSTKLKDLQVVPSTEYYLKLGWGYHELMMKYRLYAPSISGVHCKG